MRLTLPASSGQVERDIFMVKSVELDGNNAISV
jgi:hypothetical protein